VGAPPGSVLVYCADDEGARDLAGVARARGLAAVGVGERADADLRAADLRFEGTASTFTVHEGEQVLGEITLQIPGRHYVLDALAALAVGLRLGFPFEGLKAGLEGFAGTRRRMERKGEAAGVRVYDSYAHHPVEIAGDLQAGRSVAGEGRLVVAFQPHLVSRTRIFGTAMGEALGAADEVVVLDVYLAREDADPEVTGALVAGAVPLPSERVAFVADFDAVATELVVRARPGDLVLTLGAGSVTQIGPQVLALLEERAGA
jgi:UDP-N-acetylmuramate--alanine ligase